MYIVAFSDEWVLRLCSVYHVVHVFRYDNITSDPERVSSTEFVLWTTLYVVGQGLRQSLKISFNKVPPWLRHCLPSHHSSRTLIARNHWITVSKSSGAYWDVGHPRTSSCLSQMAVENYETWTWSKESWAKESEAAGVRGGGKGCCI